MKHGSLFSGIGGFDLASRWAGFDNTWQCEIEPYCRALLTKRFPEVKKLYGDIRELKGAERVDIISGGFPCQPFSQAGKRKGSEDNHFLWHEMLRVIAEVKPRWVVGENVSGLYTIDNGEVFERVCRELGLLGYSVQPIRIPACAVGAPHRRDRWWFVAKSELCGRVHGELKEQSAEAGEYAQRNTPAGAVENTGRKYGEGKKNAGESKEQNGSRDAVEPERPIGRDDAGFAPKSSCVGRNDRIDNREERHVQTDQRTSPESESERKGRIGGAWEIGSDAPDTETKGLAGEDSTWNTCYRPCPAELSGGAWRTNWLKVATKFCGVSYGLPVELDGLKLSRAGHRVERLKGLGNAIVPQIAYAIFEAIKIVEGIR